MVKAVPDGYHTATPYLAVRGAARALEFYKRAFGAKELIRHEAPGGKIGHAEIQIGDSRIMLADEYPDMGFLGPESTGGPGVMIHLYVEDVDALAAQLAAAGAKEMRPVQDQFYGDRSGAFRDPFGHVWNLSTHKEDLSPEEMQRRTAEAMKKAPEGDH